MHLSLPVLTTAQAHEKAVHHSFKFHGLTRAQLNVLALLAQQPAGMRASDLASALIVDPVHVAGLLEPMKEKGLLLELETRPARRLCTVGLSPKGRVVWRSAHREYEKLLAVLTAPPSTSENATTAEVLQPLAGAAANLS